MAVRKLHGRAESSPEARGACILGASPAKISRDFRWRALSAMRLRLPTGVSLVIKTGPHLKQAREALGWTPLDLARALRLAGGDKQGEKRVLEMEAGRRDISGPVTVAMESFLRGFLPNGFKPEGDGAGAA
jgi:hypothetical protein